MSDLCACCGEIVTEDDEHGAPVAMQVPGVLRWEPHPTHRECVIREVIGGIGHLTDHAFWCRTMHDPDAGLTYHESARRVLAWIDQHGIEAAIEKGSD